MHVQVHQYAMPNYYLHQENNQFDAAHILLELHCKREIVEQEPSADKTSKSFDFYFSCELTIPDGWFGLLFINSLSKVLIPSEAPLQR